MVVWTAIAGVCNSLVGSFLSAAGYAAQKYVHNLVKEGKIEPGNVLKNPLFVTGYVLLIVGAISAVGNLGLLGQAAQAPFASLGLIYNALLAWKVNKERLGIIDVMSSVIICVGIGVSLVFAALTNESYSLDDMMGMYTSPLAIIYTSGMFCLLLLLSLAVFRPFCLGQGLHGKVPCEDPANIDPDDEDPYEPSNDKDRTEKMTDPQDADDNYGPLGLICFSFTAGILSGTTGLCVKTAIEVIKSDVSSGRQDWHRPEFWLFVLLIPVSLYGQLRFMNFGLKDYDSLQFVPCYQSSIVVANYLSGTVYFQEYRGRGVQELCNQAVGIVVVLVGVLVLLQKRLGAHKFENDVGAPGGDSSTERDGHVAMATRSPPSNAKGPESVHNAVVEMVHLDLAPAKDADSASASSSTPGSNRDVPLSSRDASPYRRRPSTSEKVCVC